MSAGPHPEAVARTSEEARRGRSDAEWAAIDDPEGVRRAWEALLAAEPSPDRDRALRRGFASAYAAYSRRDWEFNTLLLDPRIVFRAADVREALPDMSEKHEGVQGYLEAQDLLLASWPDARVELVDVLAADPGQVVSLMRFNGHGRGSGVALDWTAIGDHRVRDGLVLMQTYWWDTRRGARELGLELPGDAPRR